VTSISEKAPNELSHLLSDSADSNFLVLQLSAGWGGGGGGGSNTTASKTNGWEGMIVEDHNSRNKPYQRNFT